MFKASIKRIVVSMLVFAMFLGAFPAPSADAAVVRSVRVGNANGTNMRNVGVVTLNNIMMANAVDLMGAMENYAAVAANQADVTLAAGTMEITYGNRRLFLGAGSRQAYLTSGVGSQTPTTTLANLRVMPVTRTVAGAPVLFVPFADTMRALGISVGREGARIREVARSSDITWTSNARAVAGVTAAVPLLAKGATFQEALNDAWFAAYNTISAGTDSFLYTRPGPVAIEGSTSGSGFGRNITRARAVDFGGTDDPLSAAELADYALIPAAMGAVTVITNVQGLTTPLNLTADIVADIYRGVITRWDDARIIRINGTVAAQLRGLTGANMIIRPGIRRDSSGTTFIFTAWLRSAAPHNWPTDAASTRLTAPPGSGLVLVLPATDGGSALRDVVNAGTANIGFVVLADARAASPPAPVPVFEISRIRNRSGIFVAPTIQSTMAAGLLATDLVAHPVNSAHPGAYPVVGLTWYMVERDVTVGKSDFSTRADRDPAADNILNIYDTSITTMATGTRVIARLPMTGAGLDNRRARMRVFKDFIDWAIIRGFGDRLAVDRHYAPLSPNMKAQVQGILNTIVN